MDVLIVSIGVGLVISLLFSEVFGLAAGGMVVPGYIALSLHHPVDVVLTLVAALERMTVSELRERYTELFTETTRARNRIWLIRRIIWRMQSLEQGGLSERAIRQANELANGADLRVTAPRESKLLPNAAGRTKTVPCQIEGSSRVPLPGTVITRCYKGRLIQVKVVTGGFEFQGEFFKSLSAVAKCITGSHWNGYKFFNLNKEGESQ